MAPSSKGLGPGLVAGIAAGGVFLLFWLVLGLSFPLSLGAGALSMGGVLAIALGLRPADPAPGKALGEYVDQDLAKKVVEDSRKAAAELEAACGRMEPGSVRTKFLSLAKGLGRIGKDVAEDPRDALAASIFLSNNGEAALRMAHLYLKLRKDGPARNGNQATLAKLDDVLDRMVASTELELSKLQADEWDALKLELDLMEESDEPFREPPEGPKGQAIGGL